MLRPSKTRRQSRNRELLHSWDTQDPTLPPKDSQDSLDWQQQKSYEHFQRQEQQRQRYPEQPPSYLDTIAAPPVSPPIQLTSSDSSPIPFSFPSMPSLFTSDDPQSSHNVPINDDEDITWLLVIVLITAFLISLATIIRICWKKARWLSLSGNSDRHRGAHGSRGHGHGPGAGSLRHPGPGPLQVPGEDDPDPDQGLNENDERWALLTDSQRQAYDSSRAFQAAHPPLSVPTDISLSQYLSIQEKGVSAWEFEATYDNHRVQIHDRTEISFPSMNQLEASVQTNLPMPKQQEVYYWEVKMFEKSPDTVVSVGVSTKPYPNTRLPGWTRHSVAYFSKDGKKYCNSPFNGYIYGPAYFEGDVIGCGYRPRTGTIFFTRNGKRLEDAYTGISFNLFPTVGATGACALHVNLGQSGFVFVEANVKKWGLAPANGSLVPPPAYGSERGSILLEAGSTMPSAPPTRRPALHSSQSRARIEAAGVLVQIDDDNGAGERGSDYGKKITAVHQHISLSKISGPPAPPNYSSVVDHSQDDSPESDDEATTALIAKTISRPVGRVRSGTVSSTASGSGRGR